MLWKTSFEKQIWNPSLSVQYLYIGVSVSEYGYRGVSVFEQGLGSRYPNKKGNSLDTETLSPCSDKDIKAGVSVSKHISSDTKTPVWIPNKKVVINRKMALSQLLIARFIAALSNLVANRLLGICNMSIYFYFFFDNCTWDYFKRKTVLKDIF